MTRLIIRLTRRNSARTTPAESAPVRIRIRAANAARAVGTAARSAAAEAQEKARAVGSAAKSAAAEAQEKTRAAGAAAKSAAAEAQEKARAAGAAARSAAAEAVSLLSSLAEEAREGTDAIVERDPAVHSRAEALLLYPGLHALLVHRVAHALYLHEHFFAARAVSQLSRFLTGTEIHPGASIGRGLFIDHGSGVVIGETAVVGDNCTIYQGATLGGTGKETGKRHPTLGDNVMVGAGAKLLGNFTIGDNVKIAAGAVVLRDVPPNCTAVGIPARVVRCGGERMPADLDQTHIPDPVAEQLRALDERLRTLENGAAPEN